MLKRRPAPIAAHTPTSLWMKLTVQISTQASSPPLPLLPCPLLPRQRGSVFPREMSLSFSMLRTADTPDAKKPRTENAAGTTVPQSIAASTPARALSTSAGAALSSLAEAKRQMQAARDAKLASEGPKPKQPSRAAAVTSQKRPTTPPPSASSLLSLRLARESALDAKRALEHRLGSILWAEFGKQALAIEFMRSQRQHTQDNGANAERASGHPNDLKLFAVELPPRKRADGRSVHTGARRFIVTTYADFWVRYFTFAPSLRHHYELILEGAPCHLYFDIEFKWKHNPRLRPAAGTGAGTGAGATASDSAGVDVEMVMRALCAELVDVLNARYGAATLGATSSNILQLDSTSSSKFSRHLIVRLCGPVATPTAPAAAATASSSSKLPAAAPSSPPPPPRFMFRDNAHAGRFVRFFCQHIAKCAIQHAATVHTEAADAAVTTLAAADLGTASSAPLAPPSDSTTLQRAERLRLLHYVTVREPADSSSVIPPEAVVAASVVAAPPLFQTTSMIDPSVYTRNRSFRLFLSSKNTPPTLVPVQPAARMDDEDGPTPPTQHPQLELEPAPVLLVADVNQHPLSGLSLQDIFLNSLVCNVQCPPNELQLLTFSETDQVTVEPAAAHTLFAGGTSECSATNANGKRVRAASAATASSSGGGGSRSRFHPGPSPFPRLEQFLSTYLHERVSEAKVRGWTYFKEQSHDPSSSSSASSLVVRHTVSFTVDSSYRWCGNVGRMHRSNGVYFILDLLTAQMSQRCWDPSCKYYSSPPIDVPRWIVEMDLAAVEDGDADGEGDDGLEAEAEEQALRDAMDRAAAKSNPSATIAAAAMPVARPSLLDDDDGWDLDALDALEVKALRQRAEQ